MAKSKRKTKPPPTPGKPQLRRYYIQQEAVSPRVWRTWTVVAESPEEAMAVYDEDYADNEGETTVEAPRWTEPKVTVSEAV
jgi:hypothetical protein